jgi:UDP-N-acetylmuramyl pentapeptide phosphotransferase/UDP-N-acetylglucosamine-1-phosphate transferase/phage tail protein X
MTAVLVGAGVALVITLFGTPVLIRLLVRREYGQFIRQDGPTSHQTKRGTPTMGGVIIILATVVGYGVANIAGARLPHVSGLLLIYLMVGMGLVGFLDDFIKISRARSLGLDARAKIILQAFFGISFAVLALQFPSENNRRPASTALSWVRDMPIDLAYWGAGIGLVLFIIWANFLITAWTNAVNLTDGLDGLATGTSAIVFAAYAGIAFWQSNQSCQVLAAPGAGCYEVRDPRDLTIIAACIVGACAVFFEAMLGEMGVVMAPGTWMIVAVVVGVIALVLNLRESAIVARTLLGIGFVGIAAMLVLAVVILVIIATGNAPVSTGIDLSTLTPGDAPITAIMTASVFGFLSWAGFESGSSLGEETDNPKRVIPRSLLMAVIIGGLVYVFMMFAQTLGFGTDAAGIEAFASAASTLTTLASTYIGPWFAILISIIAFLVAFGAFLSSSTAASRLLFALARDGFGPKRLASQHPVTKVPTVAVSVAVVLTTLMALALGAFGATSVDAYYWYATIGTLCMVIAYGMTSVGVIRHTFRPNSGIAKWELIFPIAALVYLVYVYVIQVAGQVAPYTYFPWIAGVWCLVGLIIVVSWPALAKRIGGRLTIEEIDA